MTISVSGTDLGGMKETKYIHQTAGWESEDQSGDGRVAIIVLNSSGRFAERRFERLQIKQGGTNLPFEGAISGTVKELGAPVARVVRVYRRSDGQMAGETISDAGTGAYSFSNLDENEQYFVMSFDDLNVAPTFNALVFDQVEPV